MCGPFALSQRQSMFPRKMGALPIPAVGVALLLITMPMVRAGEVTLNWLDKTPLGVATGVSWGVPFGKAEMVKKDQPFSLKTPDGKSLPLQSWPLAYWADGTIKWMGFATTAGPDVAASVLSTQAGAPRRGRSSKSLRTINPSPSIPAVCNVRSTSRDRFSSNQ